MAKDPMSFTNVTFLTTEKQFDKEKLQQVKRFLSVQKNKQQALGLMIQYFIDNIGYVDLCDYDGRKLLNQSRIIQDGGQGASPAPIAAPIHSEVSVYNDPPPAATDHQDKPARSVADPSPSDISSTKKENSTPSKRNNLPGRDAF